MPPIRRTSAGSSQRTNSALEIPRWVYSVRLLELKQKFRLRASHQFGRFTCDSLLPFAIVIMLSAASLEATVSVAISPRVASVTFTQKQQFKATVLGTSNTAVTWSVDGFVGGNTTVGFVSTSGLYTPPKAIGTHQVKATSEADASQSATAPTIVTNYLGLFTYHNNNSRTGLNSNEIVLTPANVNSSQFGKLFPPYTVDAWYTVSLSISRISAFR